MAEAAANAGGHDNARLPLDSFTQSSPPGWVTGIKRYPIGRYAQLLKLWWLQTDPDEAQWGPAK
eukprot:4689431-Pyramimonas_sp.AAC.2